MKHKKKIAVIALVSMFAIAGCNKWKDHTTIGQQDLTINLLQAISANPDLSKFKEYVSLTGLDTVLQASKTFTVWAPTNTALQTIDPAVVADKVKLKAFILNHISNQMYFTKDVTTSVRIQMLSGKYNNFSTIKFDEASLGVTDKYVSNGVLHTINAMAPPLQNIWEFINSTTAQYTQNAFIVSSLTYNFFDPSLAIIDSISVVTGLPVYRPGTGIVQRNLLTDRTYDLNKEDKQYTYFVMQDANFTLESDSLKPYYNTGGISSITDLYAKLNVVKDLVYDVPYQTPFAIPQPLLSKSGVSVPVNNAFVVDIKRMSNGYVYIMSKLDVPTKNKFLPILMEGENPSGFLSNDKRGNTNYRLRLNPVTGLNFTDILISGHAVTNFYSFYRTSETPTLKYQVYAKATNEFQAAAFSQTINAWNTSLGALTGTLTHAVPLYTATGAYNEVYVGDITNSRFGTVEWRVTAVTTGPILLDYIRLVPVP